MMTSAEGVSDPKSSGIPSGIATGVVGTLATLGFGAMVLLPRQLKTGPKAWKYGPALSLGANLTAGMLAFTFIGYSIDKHFGEGETFTLIGLFLGLIYGGYEVWKVVRYLQREDARKAEDDGDHGPEQEEGPRP